MLQTVAIRGYRSLREIVLPLLDGIADGGPRLLIEPTAGGGSENPHGDGVGFERARNHLRARPADEPSRASRPGSSDSAIFRCEVLGAQADRVAAERGAAAGCGPGAV